MVGQKEVNSIKSDFMMVIKLSKLERVKKSDDNYSLLAEFLHMVPIETLIIGLLLARNDAKPPLNGAR